MAILTLPEHRLETAANGRFFITSTPYRTEAPTVLPDREMANQALETLKKIQQLREQKELRASLPHLIGLSVYEVDSDLIEYADIWRQQTDQIAYALARSFPRQTLPGSFFDNETSVFLSDGTRLYKVNADLQVWTYYSVMSQNEMNVGIQSATEDMWQDLLFHISLAPQPFSPIS